MCLAFLVLFPVFAKLAHGPDAKLVDGAMKPMANVSITFANGEKTTTNQRGDFWFPGSLLNTRPVIPGMSIVLVVGHTGGNPGHTFTYSPIGTVEVAFLTESGKAFPFEVTVARPSDSGLVTSRGTGLMRLQEWPIGVPTRSYRFQSSNPGWVVSEVQRTGDATSAKLLVRFRKTVKS